MEIKKEVSDDIILFCSNNKDIKQNLEFDINLWNKNIGNYNRIEFPSINIDDIKKRAKKLNYTITEEDNKILNNTLFCDSNSRFFENILMHYSKYKMSIYFPHEIKAKDNIISIFLDKKQKQLSILDFNTCIHI